MLQNFNAMLREAYRRHYAVGSFNAYNYETIRGILDAGRAAGGLPMIVAFGYKYLGNMSLGDAYAIVGSIAGKDEMPVCLHLDHCDDLDTIWRAIRAGFGSVMYDGSTLPFEENAENTRRVCEAAHACGVSVEAELGSLAAGDLSHEGTAADREVYTDPQAAKAFIDHTGVDALAVSVGTVHGLYQGKPNIRIDILKEINELAQIPLVLHGGSGTPESDILACIQNGISKINVNTEISSYTIEKTKELLSSQKLPHLSSLAEKQQKYVSQIVEKYMRFFMAQ